MYEAIIIGLILPIFFIEKSNNFPLPLSKEKESEYIDKHMQGDKNARTKLIEHNLRLVAHVVKKYATNKSQAEDLISIGTIGLIKAISTYSKDKGTKLATYAAKCIENEILMKLRSNKKKRSEISIEEPIGSDGEGNEITLLDILSCEGDDVIDKVCLNMYKDKLYKCIESMFSQREQEIIKYRYGIGVNSVLTQREIANKLNISRSYVSRIEKKVLEKLREELE